MPGLKEDILYNDFEVYGFLNYVLYAHIRTCTCPYWHPNLSCEVWSKDVPKP